MKRSNERNAVASLASPSLTLRSHFATGGSGATVGSVAGPPYTHFTYAVLRFVSLLILSSYSPSPPVRDTKWPRVGVKVKRLIIIYFMEF